MRSKYHTTTYTNKKRLGEKKIEDTNVLIPWYPISYLTITSNRFFWGRLRVPPLRCNLVVPADWGWGHSIQIRETTISFGNFVEMTIFCGNFVRVF